MKLSLRWIFDHLDASYSHYSAEEIVKKLITSTAEIEHYAPVTYDLQDFTIAQVKEITDASVTLFSPELTKNFTLPARKNVENNEWYVITLKTNSWTTLKEWHHSDKEKLLPAVTINSDDQKGGWKKSFEKDDVILEVDNKSITNRPDLWGHRGFARELSVLLKVPLKKESTLLKKIPLLTSSYADTSNYTPFTVEIKTSACSHIAVVPIKCSLVPASFITMAARLARVELRPINAIVDMTNYVMADLGHPMHAFDADVYSKRKLVVRKAQSNESLILLDGTNLELTSDDIVIANEKEVLSLAGIKGGAQSGIRSATTNILLEAGCFDATTIRLSSARHKIRTDASARFEKTLDSQGTIKAVERFLALCDLYKVNYSLEGCLVVSGSKPEVHSVMLLHSVLETKIGMAITSAEIVHILTTLGMQVSTIENGVTVEYKVEIPFYRSSKDIRRPEDIIEEIARVIGYDNITPVLPQFATRPHLHSALYALRKIKTYLAYAMHLSEVENYALFDNSFIKKIGFDHEDSLALKNPLTEERTTLVTSLIPHLLQNVLSQYEHHEEIGFFEWAHIFNNYHGSIEERKVLAGILYNKKQVDFYGLKQHIEIMIASIGYKVTWKENKKKAWWAASYKVTDVYVEDMYIGTLGQLSEQLLSHFSKGQVLCFELYLDELLQKKQLVKKAQPLLSHQTQSFDISFMIHQSITVKRLTDVLHNVDNRIIKSMFIDSYYKPEWKEKKSMTFRCIVYGHDKVLSKEELEALLQHVEIALEGEGAELR